VEAHGLPDVIHAHSVFYGGMAAAYIARQFKVPLVITEHLTAYIMGTISNDYDRKLAVDIFNQADASLIVSENFKGDIEKELTVEPTVFRVVHNMVADLFFEDFKVRPYDRANDEFVLFTNSFLLPRKNHKLILDCLRVLLDKKIKVRLKVGGDGPLREELKAYASSLGMDPHIDFLGGLTRRQVKEHVSESHAFILASFYETFGVVLIESLACGRPVITTDSGGPRDFIDDSNGIIVREFSPGKMAAAVEQVIDNYDQYDQQALSRKCFDRFNERKIAGELDSIYKELISRRLENT
jgi:glycosyltransferase involved in cell wall biosynthesis